jgi:hypothetical protein
MCDYEDEERRPVPNPIVAPNGAYTIIALSRSKLMKRSATLLLR